MQSIEQNGGAQLAAMAALTNSSYASITREYALIYTRDEPPTDTKSSRN